MENKLRTWAHKWSKWRLKQMANGDSTTTATVLAQTIVNEGLKAVAAGMNPMDLKRGIDKAVIAAVEELKKISQPCADSKTIARVGTISATLTILLVKSSLKRWTKLVRKALSPLKRSGAADELDVVEGMQFVRGYLSPYFINNQESGSVNWITLHPVG